MTRRRRPRQCLGDRTLNANWTPKRAHGFAMRRVRQIELLLQEIAYTYGDVYQPVVSECNDIIDQQLDGLKEAIDEALEAEAML